MIPILFSLFVLAIVYQLYFLIFIFAKLNRYETPGFEESVNNDGISVIVCAWNEIENLKELIPLLDNQNYPDFEVIIVDDRSVDGSYDYLLANCHLFKNVRFLRIEHTPEHLSAKKYALTLGIRSAKYDILLLTDADCRPQSESWISGMKACLSQEKEIVLGFSPYYKTKGFLNRLIQYETFVTALQYFSFALSGMPYMGVGRNLMYRKEIYQKQRICTAYKYYWRG
ncbi:glycosyltransferase [Pseudarcicella hirudinis]|uniref:glycosyltransferase n=1 Tax=Pseudarcicella hirudinis TaxID=1079859 RepID=UPI0035EDEFB3